MALSEDTHTALSKASDIAILAAMGRLHEQFANRQWLSKDNRYRTNVIDEIEENAPNRRELRDDHLVEYIAVSSVLHCFDGWSFFGRALDAEMAGAPDVSRHLGYYAELRAAMSVLASQGVGIFNRTHVVVDRAGGVRFVQDKKNRGTHGFLWPALEHWANRRGESVLFSIVEPHGVPLSTWFAAFRPSGGGLGAVARGLMKQWGVDLALLAADREARNAASYRPNTLEASDPRGITEVLRSVTEFWRFCEPQSPGGFGLFDNHLLGQGLEWVFRIDGDEEQGAHEKSGEFEERIGVMLDGLNLPSASRATMRRFLLAEEQEAALLTDAQGNVAPAAADHSKQVLARAAVLLRLATGCARRVVEEADADPRDLFGFWCRSDAVNRRLWPTDTKPPPAAELWTDAEAAVGNLEAWLDEGAPGKTRLEFWKRWAAEAAVLSTTERICLWGLGL